MYHYMCKLTKTPSFHQHHFLLHGGEEIVQGDEEVLGELNKIQALVCRLLKKGGTHAVRQYYMCLCLNVHVFFFGCTCIKIQCFAESLHNCIRPRSSVTPLHGRFRAWFLPHKDGTMF